MVKQMGIDIGHDGRELPGFYDVFAGDADGHTGDDNFLIYSQYIPKRNVVKIVQSIAQRAHTH